MRESTTTGKGDRVFAGWGSRVARFRWPVLIATLAVVIGAGVWGMGVFGQLTEGGYADPASESARAADTVADAVGGQGGDVIAVYTPARGATIDDDALTGRIRERLAALPPSSVTATVSYWDTRNPAYAAKDKSSAVAIITLAGADDAAKTDAYGGIENRFAVDGATVQLAGGIPLTHTSNKRSTDDLGSAELISMPIVLILLLFIFGSLVAASLPVIIGGCAVLGSLGVLNAIALGHEVNSFAVNVASLLGLGMAIDYGLFMVGRFREEQAAGHDPAEAVRRTVATAGRTVVFSATLLMTALAGLLLFPQGFLKSLAYGGLAAVFLAMLLSLTLLPAILAILGPRVDKLPVRLPFAKRGAESGGWQKLAGSVLRRPVLVAIPILAGLIVLALPIKDVRFGENDERMLPAGDPARVAVETLKASYPQFSDDGVQVVLRGPAAAGKGFAAELAKIPGVASVNPSGSGKDVTVLNAALTDPDSFSPSARHVVDTIRGMTPPAGTQVLVGGVTARNVDSVDAIRDRLPLMIGLLTGATLLLMFLAFGSVLLPIKAVVMSGLSLSATFGLLVWLFQQGHGSGLLDVTPAPLEAGIVVLMAAVVFGLSTDYEVFLLSRMVEARTKGATTAEAVTTGLSRTGRVISAAAILLIVVTGAFALSTVTTMRFVGVGMIIALVLDATVVRMLLVPAVLALLGDAAWWAPGPLRRLQEKAGIAEHAGELSGTPSVADAETEILEYAAVTAHRTFAGSDDATTMLPVIGGSLVTAPDETSIVVWDPDGGDSPAVPVSPSAAPPAPSAALASSDSDSVSAAGPAVSSGGGTDPEPAVMTEAEADDSDRDAEPPASSEAIISGQTATDSTLILPVISDRTADDLPTAETASTGITSPALSDENDPASPTSAGGGKDVSAEAGTASGQSIAEEAGPIPSESTASAVTQVMPIVTSRSETGRDSITSWDVTQPLPIYPAEHELDTHAAVDSGTEPTGIGTTESAEKPVAAFDEADSTEPAPAHTNARRQSATPDVPPNLLTSEPPAPEAAPGDSRPAATMPDPASAAVPADSANPAVPAEPTDPAIPANLAEMANQVNPLDLADPGSPTDPANPPGPAERTKSAERTETSEFAVEAPEVADAFTATRSPAEAVVPATPDPHGDAAVTEVAPVSAIPVEVADAFTWRSDPRIAGIIGVANGSGATSNSDFPWLLTPATATAPDTTTPHGPEPAATEDPGGRRADTADDQFGSEPPTGQETAPLPEDPPARPNRPATLGDLLSPPRRSTRPAPAEEPVTPAQTADSTSEPANSRPAGASPATDFPSAAETEAVEPVVTSQHSDPAEPPARTEPAETAQIPPTAAQTEEPPTAVRAEESPAHTQTEEPPAQIQTGEPTAQTQTSESTAQTQTSEPTAQTRAGEPAAQTQTSEPAAQTQAGEPAAQTPSDEPTGRIRAEEPLAEVRAAETPAQAKTAETAVSGADAAKDLDGEDKPAGATTATPVNPSDNGRRPQTLNEWLHGGEPADTAQPQPAQPQPAQPQPAPGDTQHRPQTLGDVAPVSAAPVSPAPTRRPQTLDEWLHGNPAQPRPQGFNGWMSANDRPVSSAAPRQEDMPTSDNRPASAATPHPQSLNTLPNSDNRPASAGVQHPQNLNALPDGDNRPVSSGAPRPQSLGDMLSNGKPPVAGRRPATLADHLPDPNRPRRSNGGPAHGDRTGGRPTNGAPASAEHHPEFESDPDSTTS